MPSMYLRAAFAAALVFAAAPAAPALAEETAPPPQAAFAASPDEVEALLGGACETLTLRDVEVGYPGASSQSQIDCVGYVWRGAPRVAEFVFLDDALALVWVLVEADELDALEADFIDAYGAPSHRAEAFAAFADHEAAVRRDTPEALFYGAHVSDVIRGWFDANTPAAAAAATQ